MGKNKITPPIYYIRQALRRMQAQYKLTPQHFYCYVSNKDIRVYYMPMTEEAGEDQVVTGIGLCFTYDDHKFTLYLDFQVQTGKLSKPSDYRYSRSIETERQVARFLPHCFDWDYLDFKFLANKIGDTTLAAAHQRLMYNIDKTFPDLVDQQLLGKTDE